MDKKLQVFLALVPPSPFYEEIQHVRKTFADRYHTTHALRSPPHITLIPPFHISEPLLKNLDSCLNQFSKDINPVPLILNGFGHFQEQVIFIHVEKCKPLLTLHNNLRNQLSQSGILKDKTVRPFHPHLTLAFRDMGSKDFQIAWSKYKELFFHAEFMTNQLTLLLHQNTGWVILNNYSFRVQ